MGQSTIRSYTLVTASVVNLCYQKDELGFKLMQDLKYTILASGNKGRGKERLVSAVCTCELTSKYFYKHFCYTNFCESANLWKMPTTNYSVCE